MSDPTCLFCRIVASQVPAEVLRETELTLAFRDVNPQAPTHVLLIPKEHIASVAELDDAHAALLTDLMRSASQIARAEGIDEDGWRLVTNVGPGAGQSVLHLHFHLLGGRPMTWPPG